MSSVRSPEDAVRLCMRYYELGRNIIRAGRSGNKMDIVRLGEAIIDVVDSWRDSIKAYHVFRELMGIGSISIRDYEGHAELLKRGLELLEAVLNQSELEDIINKYDDYIRSLYYFARASTNRELAGALSIESYIGDLNKAIQLAPRDPTPRFFKALWIEQYVSFSTLSGEGASSGKTCSLLREALEEATNVVIMDREWHEAQELRSRLETLERTLCGV